MRKERSPQVRPGNLESGKCPAYLNPGVQVKDQCEPTDSRPQRRGYTNAGGTAPKRTESFK